ncbi:glutathione S-transferase 1 [Lepeophtheirus salmonis]|uniref:glutathione S-transferase 1 n=1 Tax=Lepeophtheirus salmonis TaxID=72036 RepID=UPI001AE803BC|nr:glutathione S-transferase 1-like [Lepeophtheirus salmonis]
MGWSNIELYYNPGSPHCRAVLMCIKALDLDVELSKLDLYQKFEHRRPWFVKLNPQHTLPTLKDEDFVLWESRAIMSYLVNKYGDTKSSTSSLYPKDPKLRAIVDRILFFDIGTLYKNIIDYFHPIIMYGDDGNEQKENALKTSLDILDTMVKEGGGVYLVNNHITIADFSVLASVTQLEGIDYSITGYKNLSSYVEGLKKSLSYYDECNKKGIEIFRAWVNSKKTPSNAHEDTKEKS